MARAKKDKDGRFYEVIELERGLDRKRQRKYIRAKTVSLLKDKVARFLADQEQGQTSRRRANEAYTVAAWLRVWLEGEQARGTIRPSTIRRYASDVRNHINPLIGHILLRALTYDHVQQMLDLVHTSGKKSRKQESTGEPLSARSIRNILSPLTEALDVAMRRGLVKQNVTKDVELPSVKEPDLYEITPEEMRIFLQAVRGDRHEALYWLATLGLRQGELLGLRWSNCNLDTAEVHVVEAAQRVKQKTGPGKMQWVAVKTDNGRRIIRLPADWIHVLLEHRTRQDQERRVDGWREHGLVFPSTTGTMLEPQNLVNRYFKPALTRAGLPAKRIRFHDLRHAAASMLIALGYDARTVADILGHSSPDFTLRQYAHSFEEVRERAIVDLGDLLREPSRTLDLSPKTGQREGVRRGQRG